MLSANPELLSIHPLDALGADEDIMLLEQSFFSYNPQAFAIFQLMIFLSD